MAPLSRALALVLSAAIVSSAPGSAALAAELGKTSGEPSIPALPTAASAPGLAPVTAFAGVAAPAAATSAAPAGQAPAAQSQAAALGRAAAQSDAGASDAVYDNAQTGVEAPLAEPPRALGLIASDLENVVAFTATLQRKATEKFPEAGFHKRDYISWRNFIRFYTPEYGLKEALRRGALYVYRDRLETEPERASFDDLLNEELDKLSLSAPQHGKDATLAKELLARAEPAAIDTPADEASPFNMPLSELIPDPERSKLVMTPTVLNRLDSVMQSFALRDYALLVGPPAAVKSALPRYIASHFKIPFLAVTMHPGIGTFELVGGYRPRELKIADENEAKTIVGARLAQLAKGGDKGAFLDAAAKVYGPGDLAQLEAKTRGDLDQRGDPAAARRIVTLAHALRFGESSLVWQDGYLTYAIKRDIWINFEELNAAPTEVLEFLNEFMRSRRLVVSQRLGHAEVISPRMGGRFMLWATMNPETDSNRNVLARTLKSRWRIKQFGELPSLETAQILEQTVGMPNSWALALAENIHKDMVAKAKARTIGGDWRDGYVYNLRHLLRAARRWKYFVSRLPADKRSPTGVDSLKILAREAYSVYSAQIRERPEREAVFTELDQALKLRDNGITFANLLPETRGFQDLGDRIRIGDVELKKGPGGPLTPKADPDYVVDDKTWPRLYEYAKALAMGEPLLLMGESGVGKTTDLEYLFHVLNYPLHYKNLDSDTAHEEVVGGYVTGDRRGVYVFQEGMLPRAIQAGDGVLLDEINLNPLAEWMNTLIDDNSLYLPHRIVRGRPFLTGAANPPEPSRYGGRLLMSPAFRSRWHEFWVEDDSTEERYKFLMKSWLGGAMAAWGRAEAGVASWLDAVKGLAGRFGKKKSALEVEPEPASAEPEQGNDGEPASLEELLRERKIPEGEWPGIQRRVADVEAKIRMVGMSVGRDVSLEFAPGDAWAYWFGSNTITYPLDFLLSHTEDEVIGVVDHEGAHRDITVIDENLPIVSKYLRDPERHFLWNAIEDPRVNNWVIKRLPGARHYLHALYDSSVPDEQTGPPPPPPDQSELDRILRKDAGAAFDPKVLGLPHVEFAWAIQYYWRHGKAPRIRSRSAREAFANARPALDEIVTNFPRSDDPRRGVRLAHTVKAIEQIDEKIWPLYQPLVERSKRKMARQMRGKSGKSGKQGQGQGQPQKNRGGGNGMSMPEQNQPRPPKNSKNSPKNDQNKGQGEGRKKEDRDSGDKRSGDGSSKPGDETKGGRQSKGDPGGGAEKKDEQSGQGKKKRSLWDRLTGKNNDPEEDHDDGDPKPGERKDEFDDKANEAVKKLAQKAADDLKPKLPRAGSSRRRGPRGEGRGVEPGSREAKPLSLADIVKTQREQLLNDTATPWQRIYRQVAEEANRMVSHLDNLFVKNARPGDIGYFRSGRRPDMARAMRLDGRGGYRDDIWMKRVEATKRVYKVTLLIDESGSMKEKRHAALQAAVMLIESLHRLQVDVEIIGFAEDAIIHLPYGTPVTPEKKEELLKTLSGTVGERWATHDADAVKLALDRILQEDGDERIIFVVTDGEGNGPSKLDSVLPEAEAAKVGVIGIGIGQGMAYVEKAYKRFVLVHEYGDLPLAVKKEVEKFISDRELSAAKARRPGASMSLWTPAAARGQSRLPIPWPYRLATRVGGDKLRNALIVGLLGSGFAVTLLTFSPAAALITTALAVAWPIVMSPKAFLEPDHVPAELEAKAAAVYYSLPADRRLEAEEALAAVAPPRRRGRLGLLWPRVGHPFAALAAGNDDLRNEAWETFKPFVAYADEGAVLALAGGRLRRLGPDKGVTQGELAVLSSTGRPGREEAAALQARAAAAVAGAGLGFAERLRAEEIERAVDDWRASVGDERLLARARLEQLLKPSRAQDASLAAAARAGLEALLSGRGADGAALWSLGDREERAWTLERLRRRSRPYRRVLAVIAAPVLGFGGLLWLLVAADPSLARYAEQLNMAVWAGLVAVVLSPKASRIRAPSTILLLGSLSGFAALDSFLHWMWPIAAPLIVVAVGIKMAEDRAKEDPAKSYLKKTLAAAATHLPARLRRLQLELAGSMEERDAVMRALADDPEAARGLLRGLAALATDTDVLKAEKGLLLPAIAGARTPDAAWLLRQVGGDEGARLAEQLERELAATKALEEVTAEAAAPESDHDALVERAELAVSALPRRRFADNLRADEIAAAVEAVRQAQAAGRRDEEAAARVRLRSLIDGRSAGGAALSAPASGLSEELAWRLARIGRRLSVYLKPLVFLAAPIAGAGGLVWLFPQGFEPYARALAIAMFAGAAGALRATTRRVRIVSAFAGLAAASGFVAAMPDLHAVWPLLVALVLAVTPMVTLEGRLKSETLSGTVKEGLVAAAARLPARQRRLQLDLGGTIEERHAALDAVASDPESARALLPALGKLLWEPDVFKAEKGRLFRAVAAARNEEAVRLLRSQGDAEGVALAEDLERQLAALGQLEQAQAEAAAPAADRDELLERADRAVAALSGQGFAAGARAREIAAAAEAARGGGDLEEPLARVRLRALLDGRAAGGAAAWTAGSGGSWRWRLETLSRRAGRAALRLVQAALAIYAPAALLLAPAAQSAWPLLLGVPGVAGIFLFFSQQDSYANGLDPSGYVLADTDPRLEFAASLLVTASLSAMAAAWLPGFWPLTAAGLFFLRGSALRDRYAPQGKKGEAWVSGAFAGGALAAAAAAGIGLGLAWAPIAAAAAFPVVVFALHYRESRTWARQPLPATLARRLEAELARLDLPARHEERRLGADLLGSREERAQALHEIARTDWMSKKERLERLRPALEAWLNDPEFDAADEPEVLTALRLAAKPESTPALRARGTPAALALAAELEAPLTEAERAAALASPREEVSRFAAAAETALVARAEAAARELRGSGFAGAARAEAIEAALERSKAASGDAAALESARLLQLLGEAPAAGVGAASPRGWGSVRAWKALAHGSATLGLSWPVVASWLFMPTLAAAAVTAALAVYLLPLWAVRPDRVSRESAVVSGVVAARPAQEAAKRLVGRAGLPPEALPRVGVLNDPYAYLDARVAGLSEDRARRTEENNAKAFGRGLGDEGAIGVGRGLLKEPVPILEAAVAHELAHLVHGDPHWLFTWRQRWSGPSRRVALAGAAAAGAGWLFFGAPALLLAALGAAGLLGAALAWWAGNRAVRAMERRADAFAISLVGADAYAALMRRLAAWGSGWSLDHDAPADRTAPSSR